MIIIYNFYSIINKYLSQFKNNRSFNAFKDSYLYLASTHNEILFDAP